MKKTFLKKMSIVLAAVMTLSSFVYAADGEASLQKQAESASEPCAEIVWDFENGELAPFELIEGEFPNNGISSIPYEHNSPTVPYTKQGDYFFTTLETGEFYTEDDPAYARFPDGAGALMTKPSDAFEGVVRSPIFRLDEANMKVNFLVGGGNNEMVYVALCDIYGREVMKVRGNANETMVRVEWDLTNKKLTDNLAFIKVVDKSSGGWAHITFDDFHAYGCVLPDEEIRPEPAPEIKWSFEDGDIYPFTITEGEFGEKVVANWDYDRNTIASGVNTPNGKDGTYYLCTVETDGTLGYNEEFTGVIQSPVFKIMSPEVLLKLAGGPKNYVAVCDAETDEELATVSVSEGGHVFNEVSMNLGENYVENRLVYIKIVDNTTSGWGFISVDDIRVKGEIYYEPVEYHWNFEDGTTGPFSLVKGELGKIIGSLDTEINAPQAPIQKEGTYYLTTVEVSDAAFSDVQQGELRSVNFALLDPIITMKICGGTDISKLYFAVCDAATGKELAKIGSQENRYVFKDVTFDVTGKVPMGTEVFFKIVDATSSGWGFLAVDDIKFTGHVIEAPIVDITYDFESGKVEPWRTMPNSTFGRPIGYRDTDFNGNVDIQKQGKYYLTTEENENGSYNDGQTGVFRSPVFTIDVENNPKVNFLIGGGTAEQVKDGAYVALKRTDGTIVAKWNCSKNQYIFERQEHDLTGLINKYDKLYLEVYDNTAVGWGHVIFDDFHAVGTFPRELPIGSEEELSAITGWDSTKFATLKLMVRDLLDTYPDEYTDGEEILSAIEEKEALHDSLWMDGNVKPNDPAVVGFKEEMDALEKETIMSNPLLKQAPIVFVTRQQYQQDHHNTHNMLPSTDGEINSSSYLPGGTIKVIDFAKGGEVSTLKSTDTGVFRDPDVSYDGDKILISYRRQWANDSYNIYEYTLNEEKNAIVDEKQLTQMYTADHMDPMYMPSGNIVFAGTRDPKYVMCNRHISANLYRMEGDGANIVKITNSTLFERPTDVLPDGRILYDRWEYNDRDFGSAQGLWTVAEDGTQQVTYYGNNTPVGAMIDAKAIPGTQNVICTWTSTHDVAWGGLQIIDRSNGVDGRAPVLRTWPADKINVVRDSNQGGRDIDHPSSFSIKYEDPQPLSDKYFIASRQIPGKGRKTGLYLLDVYGNETLLYEDPTSQGAFDANLLMPREKENTPSDRRNYLDDVGTFFVQNVYEGTHMQGVEPGTVKTLRIVESMPKRHISQGEQWGGEGQQNPGVNWHSFEVKRTIGEVPVYEDGSAYFEVPQDKFVYFQLLDEDGRMIQSMRSGTLTQSGEKTGCIGCHEDRRMAPDVNTDRKTPMALEANFEVVPNPDYISDEETPGVPKTIGVNVPDKPQKRTLDFETGTDSLADYDDEVLYPDYYDLPSMNYLTEVQPVFTKNCISCHGYENPAADLTLVPDKGVYFNASYVDLWRNRGKSAYFNGALVGAIGGGGQEFTTAKQWGSYNSVLIKKLFEDPDHAARLTEAEKRRVAEWVDLNGTYYGDYASNYSNYPGGRSAMNWNEINSIPGGLQWSFSWGERRAAPIYFDNPEKSPILKRWAVGSNEYNTTLNLIKSGQARLIANPDVDWAGLTSMPGNPDIAITPYTPCPMDAWRIQKVKLRDAIEKANRQAIVNGEKRYDWDNEADGLKDWPDGWPGWP
ncbi:hypothetical protein H8711_08135 [Clostridiaceae bacterium NSJ-31]|uniref:Hydrazine synthase alpha subunit middle domain-containing protein n=1 Tax=Ligaoa zhengdingensis TaxID=2763658 RepID=A0A926E156_9FIRM|nr:hypothetical protein [Ligaoa zhengdingensis]MBC8546900.1 hypothetical protein [Ligaoa zhengdingensis]